MKLITRLMWGLLICLPWLPVQAAPPLAEQRNPSFSLSHTLINDDNVFRLAPDRNAEAAVGNRSASEEDYINQTALTGALRMATGRQSFDVAARVEDNRYRYNDSLDYVGGNGALTWNWAVGNDWSGDVGGEYRRLIAGFDNNQLLKKDLLTRVDYFYDFQNRLTPRWSWAGGVRNSETTHSADEHQIDDVVLNTARLGVHYETPKSDAFGLDYQYADGHFPERDNLGAIDEDYHQGGTEFWLKYVPTVKTRLDAGAGYLQRNYADAAFDDYSGGTGRIKWQWLASEKTQLSLSAWRDLRAYIDAESDYYVSRGYKISPLWQPRDTLKFVLDFSRENQDFVGVDLPDGAQERNDTVYAKQITAVYTPVALLQLDLKYRFERRESNRPFREYRDKILAAGLTLKF